MGKREEERGGSIEAVCGLGIWFRYPFGSDLWRI